jgi:hypothetical protein
VNTIETFNKGWSSTMDFHPGHQAALKIAGTVALPSPFPACGSLSILVAPEDGDYETYIRIAQIVSGRRIITRFVRLSDVRAVRAPEIPESHGGPETWPIIGLKEVARRISKKEKELRTAATKSGTACEAAWLPAAIVYVPEAAPVLHRNDVGVTAAVSAEEVAFSDLQSEATGHCALKPAFCPGAAKASFCPGH